MAAKKSTKKPNESTGPVELRIAGSDVRINEASGEEFILIDGKPVKFYKTKAGYLLNTNMFVDPQETLLDAAKLYLQRRAK
tara:strand:+ start:879 stop:1121 length:243 start_codon:yes stop_codon:yes gene_type:complete